MRLNHIWTTVLACLVVPGIGAYNKTITPRGGKFPSVGIAPKPPTVTTPKPVGGVNKPPTAIEPYPAGNNNPKTPVKACKRADSGCNINNYDPMDMDYDEYWDTASGHIKWSPAQGEAVGPALSALAKRLHSALEVSDREMVEKGNNIVGALYVPERGIFISTVPRKDGADTLVANFKEKAPGLYRATNGRRNNVRGSPNAVHVEDGVIYKFESSPEGYRINEGNQFPAGSTLAMYGAYGPGKPKHQPVPCQGMQPFVPVQRSPSCKTVLQRLGIDVVGA
ncbi:uncharacterized protein BDV14DRAFT_201494 [Aspergillus stella-maris]|uniref:uncharacterized protein n=1 Tax=Aspergillus stella-maris TaxID=1810926 RepID=UPI003CCD19D0